MTMPLPTVLDYINSKININSAGCWIWKGARKPRYGWFQYDGDIGIAHRKIYEHMRRPIPIGKILRHKCDDSRCVNPDHLLIGTKKDNRKDFMERHPRAKQIMKKAIARANSGLKKFWKGMSAEEKRRFISARRKKQIAKYGSHSNLIGWGRTR